MTTNHRRNVGPMLGSARCGARTRQGGACKSPAVAGKARCRMHGGARGSGAKAGNQNALKSGLYTVEQIELRRQARALFSKVRQALRKRRYRRPI